MSLQFVLNHSSPRAHADTVWGTKWTAADTVVSISADGTAGLWDATGQSIRALPPHPLALVSLSTDAKGSRALYNSIEGTTGLWDLESGDVLGKKESFDTKAEGIEPAWSVSLSPDASTYASTGASGTITIHSADSASFGRSVDTLSPRTEGKHKFGMFVSHSPDASRLALSTEQGQIYVFDIEKKELVNSFTSHAMCVRSLAWSADSQLLLSASDDKRLVLHDVRTASGSGRPGSGAVASLNGHSSWVLSASLSADGKYAASGSSDRTVKIWDLSSRQCVSTIQEQGEVWGVSWRPQGGALVTGGEDGGLKWWRG